MRTTIYAVSALIIQFLCTAAQAHTEGPTAWTRPVDVAAVAPYPEAASIPVRHVYRQARRARPQRRAALSMAPRHFNPPAPTQPAPEAPAAAPFSAYLADWAYSETPFNPTVSLLAALRAVPVGSPAQEIDRAAELFGLDTRFLRAVARIELDFNPREQTGRYIGLFQLSAYEFGKYGSGSITSARDNAIAAAWKFVNMAAVFEADTHIRPTLSYLYLMHQQGEAGAAEHVSHPDRLAWRSMCATDEGREKGEWWCKRAVWGNTLPSVKAAWKSVDRLTSGAFVAMWQSRVDKFVNYAAR